MLFYIFPLKDGTPGWEEECKQPCKGKNCGKLKTKIENLLDLNNDPCDDFYKFACNVANRGNPVEPVKEPLLTFEQLVENPPEGFDYVKRFYRSCTAITTQKSSSEVPPKVSSRWKLFFTGPLWLRSRRRLYRGGIVKVWSNIRRFHQK